MKAGATVRVSGQRHAQPALVAEDNRVAPSPTRWLIDLSCYKDLGPGGNQSIVLHPSDGTVTVNTGVRESFFNPLASSVLNLSLSIIGMAGVPFSYR